MNRARILIVFDLAYSAHGLAVYGAVRLLTRQLGPTFQYQVFCSGPYSGPRFDLQPRIDTPKGAPGLLCEIKKRFFRALAESHLIESPDRWESNIVPGEEDLLEQLFDADQIHAVIVFSADPAFALRVMRLAHIYSSITTPHLVAVVPSEQIQHDVADDLDWLGACLLRDGDLVLSRSSTPATAADPNSMIVSPIRSFISSEDYPVHLTNQHGQMDWAELLPPERLYRDRVRDVVLFVRPDWMNCGSGTTFGNLAGWFRSRNALLIDVGVWPFAKNFDSAERTAQLTMEQDNIRAALYFSVRRSTSVPFLIRQIARACKRLPWTLVRQVAFQYSLAAKPRLLREAIRKAKISNIYLNHYFTQSYADSLIGTQPFFLDTHDIQTVNFIHYNQLNALTGRVDRFDASLRDEMEIAGLAQRLCFVSPYEIELASKFISVDRLDHILPLPRVKPCEARALSFPPSLLIVASDNPGNVRSLNWFLNHIWPIVISLCGTNLPSLRICGSISARMSNCDMPGVHFVGIVADLQPYYEECDLVLLPVIAGAGVAIKTLEALLYARPVLATRHALRGLPDDIVQMIHFEDDPVVYAETLLTITSTVEHHRMQTMRSHRAAAALRDYAFYERLGSAVDSVRLMALPLRAPTAARPELNPVGDQVSKQGVDL